MPATILPFRSRNPETDLLSRRNAEEARRLLREDAGMDFDRKGLRDLGPSSPYGRFIRGEDLRWILNHPINPSPDGGAA